MKWCKKIIIIWIKRHWLPFLRWKKSTIVMTSCIFVVKVIVVELGLTTYTCRCDFGLYSGNAPPCSFTKNSRVVASMCVLYELVFISWETCWKWMPHKQGILEFGQMLAKFSCLHKALTTHCFVENWVKCVFLLLESRFCILINDTDDNASMV